MSISHSRNDDPPFTDDALRLLGEARAQAERLRHEYIGTEHVVLALADRSQGVVAETFQRRGVDRTRVFTTIDGIVKSGKEAMPPGYERPFTTRTKNAFALAADSARSFGETRVGAEHILLGLLGERKNIGAQVLADQGLTAELAREEILNIKGGREG
jgi:ATP-dependent Clp protease ATP-binding subunit ClpC